MEFDPRDQEVIQHLQKLREADPEYPPELLAERRQHFLKQMGEVGLGVAAGVKIQQALKSAKTLPTPPTTSALLEAVLVVAIIAEAGAVTYFYRDRLAKIVRDFVASGEVQEIISPPGVNTPLITTIDTLNPVDPFTPDGRNTSTPPLLVGSPTPSEVAVTPTQTPSPDILVATSPVNATAVLVNSTPDPNGDNGNHYGQTPKPERTKENNGNDEKHPKEEPPKEEEKPPKKDPPPKDPKPTKTK
jgi:hypothetical protein